MGNEITERGLAEAVQDGLSAFAFDDMDLSLSTTQVIEAEGRTFIHIECDDDTTSTGIVEFDLVIQNLTREVL